MKYTFLMQLDKICLDAKMKHISTKDIFGNLFLILYKIGSELSKKRVRIPKPYL